MTPDERSAAQALRDELIRAEFPRLPWPDDAAELDRWGQPTRETVERARRERAEQEPEAYCQRCYEPHVGAGDTEADQVCPSCRSEDAEARRDWEDEA